MSAMDRWIMAVSSDLGLDPGAADARAILEMTRDVAHNVDRPAAPVTAYLIGVAVGRGMSLSNALKRVRGLAVSSPGRTESPYDPGDSALMARRSCARSVRQAQREPLRRSPFRAGL